jgi:hypothetical protein
LLYGIRMKHIGFMSLVGCAVLFAGCESTDMANGTHPSGTQEAKRLAALRQEQQQAAQQDEAQQNLWSAQGNIVNRDGNPGRVYDTPAVAR